MLPFQSSLFNFICTFLYCFSLKIKQASSLTKSGCTLSLTVPIKHLALKPIALTLTIWVCVREHPSQFIHAEHGAHDVTLGLTYPPTPRVALLSYSQLKHLKNPHAQVNRNRWNPRTLPVEKPKTPSCSSFCFPCPPILSLLRLFTTQNNTSLCSRGFKRICCVTDTQLPE